MAWALIQDSDGAWLAGPLDAVPTPEVGQQVVVVNLGYPDTCTWDANARGFVDRLSPLTSLEYFQLFTAAEQLAIFGSDVAAVRQLWAFALAAPSLDLSSPLVIGGLDALVALGLLTTERATLIKAGLPPIAV